VAGSRLIILLAIIFCGVFLVLIPAQYLHLSVLIYIGLLFGLIIWFGTGKYKYAMIFTLAIIPLIIMSALVSQNRQNISILIFLLVIFVTVGWLMRWHSRNIAYECSKCGHLFSASVLKLLTTLHALDTRLLRCPECGYRDWFESKKGKAG
jgi:DNA-directed RNA polymerase subunit RPC12/RpoP